MNVTLGGILTAILIALASNEAETFDKFFENFPFSNGQFDIGHHSSININGISYDSANEECQDFLHGENVCALEENVFEPSGSDSGPAVPSNNASSVVESTTFAPLSRSQYNSRYSKNKKRANKQKRRFSSSVSSVSIISDGSSQTTLSKSSTTCIFTRINCTKGGQHRFQRVVQCCAGFRPMPQRGDAGSTCQAIPGLKNTQDALNQSGLTAFAKILQDSAIDLDAIKNYTLFAPTNQALGQQVATTTATPQQPPRPTTAFSGIGPEIPERPPQPAASPPLYDDDVIQNNHINKNTRRQVEKRQLSPGNVIPSTQPLLAAQVTGSQQQQQLVQSHLVSNAFHSPEILRGGLVQRVTSDNGNVIFVSSNPFRGTLYANCVPIGNPFSTKNGIIYPIDTLLPNLPTSNGSTILQQLRAQSQFTQLLKYLEKFNLTRDLDNPNASITFVALTDRTIKGLIPSFLARLENGKIYAKDFLRDLIKPGIICQKNVSMLWASNGLLDIIDTDQYKIPIEYLTPEDVVKSGIIKGTTIFQSLLSNVNISNLVPENTYYTLIVPMDKGFKPNVKEYAENNTEAFIRDHIIVQAGKSLSGKNYQILYNHFQHQTIQIQCLRVNREVPLINGTLVTLNQPLIQYKVKDIDELAQFLSNAFSGNLSNFAQVIKSSNATAYLQGLAQSLSDNSSNPKFYSILAPSNDVFTKANLADLLDKNETTATTARIPITNARSTLRSNAYSGGKRKRFFDAFPQHFPFEFGFPSHFGPNVFNVFNGPPEQLNRTRLSKFLRQHIIEDYICQAPSEYNNIALGPNVILHVIQTKASTRHEIPYFGINNYY